MLESLWRRPKSAPSEQSLFERAASRDVYAAGRRSEVHRSSARARGHVSRAARRRPDCRACRRDERGRAAGDLRRPRAPARRGRRHGCGAVVRARGGNAAARVEGRDARRPRWCGSSERARDHATDVQFGCVALAAPRAGSRRPPRCRAPGRAHPSPSPHRRSSSCRTGTPTAIVSAPVASSSSVRSMLMRLPCALLHPHAPAAGAAAEARGRACASARRASPREAPCGAPHAARRRRRCSGPDSTSRGTRCFARRRSHRASGIRPASSSRSMYVEWWMTS